MENIETEVNNVRYRKTKLVKSKNGTEYRRLYYSHEDVEKTPENEHPKQQVKNTYIKTTSRNGKVYYKNPPALYKELHIKNYQEQKEKICRRIFIKNLKTARRCPHDKSIKYYHLKEEEVINVRDQRLNNEPANKEGINKIYSAIIERIRFLNK